MNLAYEISKLRIYTFFIFIFCHKCTYAEVYIYLLKQFFFFLSPSEIYLHSLQEVAIYLQTEGTCKCGLECPLMLNKVFNFNPMATTKCWNVNDLSWNDPTKLCNHKRKIVAMATFRNSTIPLSSLGSVNPLMTPSTSKKGNIYFRKCSIIGI